MSREEIAKLIYYYASKDICKDDITELSSLLGDKRDTQIMGYDSITKIQVRDVAYTCIEELAGESFLQEKHYPIKEQLCYKQNNDDSVWRYQIISISDEEYKLIPSRIVLWTDNFKKNHAMDQKGCYSIKQ